MPIHPSYDHTPPRSEPEEELEPADAKASQHAWNTPADVEGWEGVHEQPTLPELACLPEMNVESSPPQMAIEMGRPARAPLILVVDDSRDSRDLYAEYLTSVMGCRVLAAENGLHGLRIARTCRPDVILLDISMPVMDGCEMAQHLRADERVGATPIIGVTSFGGAWHEAARASGCTEVLSKSSCFTELDAAVRAALDKSPLQAGR